MNTVRTFLPAALLGIAVGIVGCSAQPSPTVVVSSSPKSGASTQGATDTGPCPAGFLAAKQEELRKDAQPNALVTPITYADLVGSPQPAGSALANACFYVTTNTAFVFQTAIIRGGDSATEDQIGNELTSLGYVFSGTTPTSHSKKYTWAMSAGGPGYVGPTTVGLITDETLSSSPEGRAFGIPYLVVVKQLLPH